MVALIMVDGPYILQTEQIGGHIDWWQHIMKILKHDYPSGISRKILVRDHEREHEGEFLFKIIEVLPGEVIPVDNPNDILAEFVPETT